MQLQSELEVLLVKVQVLIHILILVIKAEIVHLGALLFMVAVVD
tara:strand:- start:648 stop:779 length:132 start_codon:yes stop_codon:yes gene_type:complete